MRFAKSILKSNIKTSQYKISIQVYNGEVTTQDVKKKTY
jgi:hypothetical protein